VSYILRVIFVVILFFCFFVGKNGVKEDNI